MDHHYRKISQRAEKKAIDGILNSPGRSPSSRPVARHAFVGERLRSNSSRQIDDFKRAEGYHPVSRPSSVSSGKLGAMPDQSSRAPTAADNSLLNMTLPQGGVLSGGRRHGRAKKDKKRRLRDLRKWALRSALALTAIVLLTGGFLATKAYFKAHNVFKGGGTAAALQSNVDPSLLKGEGDGRINTILFGKGGLGHDGADLTDTILLVSIDPVNKKADLLSVPRDLWVTVPGYYSMKVNAVYSEGKQHALAGGAKGTDAEKAGVQLAENTVERVLGVNINYYAMVDFAGFKQAIDTVGGVDINVGADQTVSETLWDESTGKNYYLHVTAGQQHFDGTRALFYARSRHTSPRGDFDRSERQRLLITALSQKVLSAGTLANPAKISSLLSAFGDHVRTDYSIQDAARLAKIAKGISSSKITSLDLADPTGPIVTTGMSYNGQSIVRPVAGLADFSQLQAFVRSHLRDGYLAKENAQITVLNGTDVAGLATQKGDELKSVGYNVGTVDSAPTQTYQKTIVVDLSKGKDKYTKNYLQKRFGVKTTTKLPDKTIQPAAAHFVIILGQDAATNS